VKDEREERERQRLTTRGFASVENTANSGRHVGSLRHAPLTKYDMCNGWSIYCRMFTCALPRDRHHDHDLPPLRGWTVSTALLVKHPRLFLSKDTRAHSLQPVGGRVHCCNSRASGMTTSTLHVPPRRPPLSFGPRNVVRCLGRCL
jgi:hypothetical protein